LLKIENSLKNKKIRLYSSSNLKAMGETIEKVKEKINQKEAEIKEL